MSEKVRPIRSVHIVFDNDEDYEEFIRYATSREKSNTPELQRLRRLIRTHLQFKCED